MFGWFRKNKAPGFWAWLAANTERIQSELLQDPQRVGDEIGRVFKRDYPNLTWEVAPSKDAPWAFCISADGKAERFPAVLEAAGAAPEVPGWKIRAFRPRGPLDGEIQFGDQKLGVDDIWCTAEPAGSRVNLTLWIRGLTEGNDQVRSNAAVILLDHVVGEHDSVMKIGRLGRGPLPDNPERGTGLFPLRDLPALLDRLPQPRN